VHAEASATIHLHRVLSKIRELGKKAGVVLDPASPILMIEYVLHLCDIVLIMTVNPGFGGQKFLPKCYRRSAACAGSAKRAASIRSSKLTVGKIMKARRAIDAGANAIVAGSAIFGSADYAGAIAAIRSSRGRIIA